MLFSEPKIPQLRVPKFHRRQQLRFQCSSASRKFLNFNRNPAVADGVLGFSALQRAENSSIHTDARLSRVSLSFSALQRAENSSIRLHLSNLVARPAFQCSSASRKFLNSAPPTPQRDRLRWFQCSSASRKFLNRFELQCRDQYADSFSALQRAENSSTVHKYYGMIRCYRFSALQRAENSSIRPSHLRPSIFPTAMITLRHS